jgi:pilus assembly protein Flp/PilA
MKSAMLLTKLYIHCKLFLQSKEGASGIEYAVIAAMVAVALAAFVTPISDQVTALMTKIQTAITPKT